MSSKPEDTVHWTGGLILLAVYLGSLVMLWFQDPAVAHENRLMENLQALTLAGAMAASVLGVVLRERRYPRFIFFALSVLLLGLFLREVDVERLDLPPLLVALGSGWGRALLLGAGGVCALVIFFRNFRHLWPAAVTFLKNPACSLFYLGFSLYLVGGIFDKHYVHLPRQSGFLFEELCESAATYFFLWGTLRVVKKHRFIDER